MCAARSAKLAAVSFAFVFGGLIEEGERYLEATILAFATFQESTHTERHLRRHGDPTLSICWQDFSMHFCAQKKE
ncbi:hypothetical protein BDB00DRAFT_837589 [Zychaea mexicana]|uniref:uncharacterized protein n=1 Tax=Zychaea mexicana TaxID=64656 RepID=UPI0022FDF49E|nr:uncharacterized protein BDB00DRAFT_837589 [Zychaea mexicana]KAI9490538.1 hypothetical protein BDB00DRAFT_837589 [Zychaea mexicana]